MDRGNFVIIENCVTNGIVHSYTRLGITCFRALEKI